MSIERIRQIERLAARAWPAALVENLDGWLLRFNQDVTRRANSVLPNDEGGRLMLEARLRRVEDFYAEHGLPVRYQLCPACRPPDLDGILERRGLTVEAVSQVQTAETRVVIERTGRTLAEMAGRTPPVSWGRGVTMTGTLSEEWFTTYRQAEERVGREAHGRRDILERIAPPTAFAVMRMEDRPVAVGLGVLDEGYVGVFCMATLSDWRRRGAAMRVLHGLALWGRYHHATHMYLQVTEKNEAAQALYRRAGFELLYRYHYREGSPSPRPAASRL
jgi:ribosomal protein S18 acetylase RimI-like enzyme